MLRARGIDLKDAIHWTLIMWISIFDRFHWRDCNEEVGNLKQKPKMYKKCTDWNWIAWMWRCVYWKRHVLSIAMSCCFLCFNFTFFSYICSVIVRIGVANLFWCYTNRQLCERNVSVYCRHHFTCACQSRWQWLQLRQLQRSYWSLTTIRYKCQNHSYFSHSWRYDVLTFV